jgi:hypothetical protein
MRDRLHVVIEQLRIHIERQGRGGVAEEPLHGLDAPAGIDGEAGGGVSELVGGEPG